MALVYRTTSVVDVRDHVNTINKTEALSQKQKQGIIRAIRGLGSVSFLVNTDTASITSTTLANYAGFLVECTAGRWYEVYAQLAVTNGTAANGFKAALNLTGTQTNMKSNMFAKGTNDTTAEINASAVTISTNTLITGNADTASPATIFLMGTFQPIADGVLTLQLAEKDTGSGTGVLKTGSLIRIRELG